MLGSLASMDEESKGTPASRRRNTLRTTSSQSTDFPTKIAFVPTPQSQPNNQ